MSQERHDRQRMTAPYDVTRHRTASYIRCYAITVSADSHVGVFRHVTLTLRRGWMVDGNVTAREHGPDGGKTALFAGG